MLAFFAVVRAFSESPGFAAVVATSIVGWFTLALAARLRPGDARLDFARNAVARGWKRAILAPAIVLVPAAIGLVIAHDRRVAEQKADQQAQERARAEAEHARLAAEQQAKRDQELLASSATAAGQLQRLVDEAAGLVQEARFEDALGTLNAARKQADPYLDLKPVPADVASVNATLEREHDAVEEIVRVKREAAALPAQLTSAQNLFRQGAFVDAARECADVVDRAEALASSRHLVGDLEPVRKQALALKKKVAPLAAREEKARAQAAEEARRAAAQAQALADRCGSAPLQSSWDGSYHYVESYLQDTANDPDSIDVDSCTKAVLTDRCWKTVCKYRGKNPFGGLVLKFDTFYLGRWPDANSWRVIAMD